jgi:hypothetical protein
MSDRWLYGWGLASVAFAAAGVLVVAGAVGAFAVGRRAAADGRAPR